jgi:hypothetical protein
MKPSLYVCSYNSKDYYAGKRFRFAVVDLDKPKGFPSNFICMLPIQINGKSKFETSFRHIFGDESIQQARSLLTDGLKTEEEPEVKAEIEKRLKLLDPGAVGEIRCSGCGKLFLPQRIRRHRANFCEECLKKKFGSRE